MTALIIVVAVVLTFEVCCLVDVARAKEVRRLDWGPAEDLPVWRNRWREDRVPECAITVPTSRHHISCNFHK